MFRKEVYVLSVLVIVLFVGFAQGQADDESISICGDGTFFDSCSLTKGYFCDEGVLIEKASVCGCPENLAEEGESCVSEYQTEPKEVNLKYFFEGEEKEIVFTVYEGMNDYVSNLKRDIDYNGQEEPSRGDFKLKSMNELEQRNLLIPLAVEIQNLAQRKEDQFRIATSIVQSISYGYSDKTVSFFGSELNYSRYPYEVLYENQGICGEKTQLLAFLLREVGFETALFYYGPENHEAIGVKCPVDKSFDGKGYCFVETTARAIINDDSIIYLDGITLDSEPEVFILSEGISLPEDLREYGHAKKIDKLRHGKFVFFRKLRTDWLNLKYGIKGIEEYNLE